jgi:hypothetical protein
MSNRLVRLIPILLFLISQIEAAPRIHDNRTPKERQKMTEKQLETIKLMTFNTWNLGRNVDNGPAKIAKHIQLVDPDIVGIQVCPIFFRFFGHMYKISVLRK